MVGPMDGIGLLNATRTMQSCRLDGDPKFDVPITTDDWCFVHFDLKPGYRLPSRSRTAASRTCTGRRTSAQNFTEIQAHGADVARLVQRQVRPHPGRVVAAG